MSGNDTHRYELVERIAVGGMAEVFRAKTYGLHGFEKELAVKRILPELASNREFVDRFIREAKISVNLNHANIVQVTDFSRFGDSLYIAMEFVDGVDLATLLSRLRKRSRILPLAAAMHVAIEVFKGLEFAHRRGVVHRDISPANILVSKYGEVKIADFGIAQASGHTSMHTSPARIMGKWRYMSPEQSRGEELSSRSDVFSMAVLMFEMFTGRRLFDQRDPADIVVAIRKGDFPLAGDLRPELPRGLDEILASALRPDPEQRGEASQLGRELIEVSYSEGLPVTASELAAAVGDMADELESEAASKISVSNLLIDNIINSELAQRRPSMNTRLTRITPPTGREALLDDTRPNTPIGDFAQEPTSLTFVDGGTDANGLTQWLLANTAGGPVEVPSELAGDLPTVHEPPLDGRQTEPMSALVFEERGDQRSHSVSIEGTSSHRTKVIVGCLVALAIVFLFLRLSSNSEDDRRKLASDATTSAGIAPNYLDASIDLFDAGVGPAKVILDARVVEWDAAPPEFDAGRRARDRARRDREPPERRTPIGTIDLFVKPWANVYRGGKKIGEAPSRGLKLPHGTHRLLLKNPVSGASKSVVVKVPSNKPYRFELPDQPR